MAKGVYAALSGAVAAGVALDTTAQNLANASTAGYQRLRPIFHEVLTRAGDERSADKANRFTAARGTVIDMAPGVTRTTGRPLDVALASGSFLAVATERGERYTRAGAISVDPDGFLRISGEKLVDESGAPIQVEADKSAELSISEDGQVVASEGPLARIKQVTFQQPRLLSPEGGALFAASEASGAATAADGALRVGQLEDSNATPVVAMTELMTTTRLFDAFQRAIETFRDADRRVVTLPNV